jgi:superfamily I DNA/RNA helicase
VIPPQKEIDTVAAWIKEKISEGTMPNEVGLFVRSSSQLPRAKSAVEKSKVSFCVLDGNVETPTDHISITTMHLAKGLEFRAVCVMACDDYIIPLQDRIEMAADDAELEEIYNTERHLLYVACTRARENLLVTSGDSPSEFLDDLRAWQQLGRR